MDADGQVVSLNGHVGFHILMNGLTTNPADPLLTDKMFRIACKLVHLQMDEEAPDDIWPHLLDKAC